MSDKCPPNYKNLREIQSFSEQMYPTVQWAEQNCENDEYLKQGMEQLEYLTPPAVRKRFYPLIIDPTLSWGCQVTDIESPMGSCIMFNQDTSDQLIIDFDDLSYIDLNRSDCAFETTPVTTVDSDDNVIISSFTQAAVVPMFSEYDESLYGNVGAISPIDSYWYVAYDKSKAYQVRPDWLNNPWDGEIPAIVRAQTFQIPSSYENVKLESVDLYIESKGGTISNWGSPLYVEIFPTEIRKVEKTKWNPTTKKQESYSPKQYEDVVFPAQNGKRSMARCIYAPADSSPGFKNFLFDKAITVNGDETYAITVRSPLSHYDHCPMIGGWSNNYATGKYGAGNAFLSENNGNRFIRYGRNDENVDSRFGQYTPMDFAFRVHFRTYSEGRKNNEIFYLYLKPLVSNPIKSVQVISTLAGIDSNTSVVFEVSSTGKPNDWHTLGTNYSVNFSRGSDGEYPRSAFIRAKIATTSTSKTPKITKMVIDLDLDTPKEMYARTPFYTPKTSPMLGANVWGRVYAPFTLEPSVTGDVEIIPDRIEKEHFDIITASELEYYDWIEGLDTTKIKDNDLEVRYNYLIDNPIAITLLKENNVYVKPWTHTVNGNTVKEMLSFQEGIQLAGEAAYPILECLIQPASDSRVQSYAQYIDFTYDYDNNVLNFYSDNNNDTLSAIPVGTLSVAYNPIFIKGLTAAEVGDREDGEGLILDYFKEEFNISDTELENRSVTLRVSPVDPIRKVLLNEKELHEDKDFTVDYSQKKIIFPVQNVDNVSTILNAGDELSVVYTPNLEECSISIGYHGKRTNKDKQMIIKPNYIEYKA